MIISSNYHLEKVVDKKNVIKIVINKKLKQKKKEKTDVTGLVFLCCFKYLLLILRHFNISDKNSCCWLVYPEMNNYDNNNDFFQDCIAGTCSQQFKMSVDFEIFNV